MAAALFIDLGAGGGVAPGKAPSKKKPAGKAAGASAAVLDYRRSPVERLITLVSYVLEAERPPTFEELKSSPVYAAEHDERRKQYQVLYDVLIIEEERIALARAALKGIAGLESEARRLERIRDALDAGRVPTGADLAYLAKRLEGLGDSDTVRLELYSVPVSAYRELLNRFQGREGLRPVEFAYLARLVASESAENARMTGVLSFVRDEMKIMGEQAGRLRRLASTVKSGGRPAKKDLDFMADRILRRGDEDGEDEAAHRAAARRYSSLVERMRSRRRLDDADTSYLYRLLAREAESDARVARDLGVVYSGGVTGSDDVAGPVASAGRLARSASSRLEERRQTDRLRAMFERDKSALVEMGVTLEVVERPDGRPGYRVAREKVQTLKLSAAERLALATSLRFFLDSGTPFAGPAMTLLLKLGYRCGDLSARDAVPVSWLETPLVRDALNRLTEAVRKRKSVAFSYRSPGSERPRRHAVEPYGMISRDGRWYVVGRSDLHEGVVTFRLDRIESKVKVNELRPKSADFRVPGGFDVEEATTWAWDDHTTDVTVRFGPRRDPEGQIGFVYETPPVSAPARVKNARRVRGSSLEVVYEVDYVHPFIDWVLGFGTDARVMTPREIVDLVRERLLGALKAVG